MANARKSALENFLHRSKKVSTVNETSISTYYGENVFSEKDMSHFLSKDAYKKYNSLLTEGKKIDRKLADQIAAGIKTWALEKNVTHYTHWFQPLTGATAEKHDSFFVPDGKGGAIEQFSSSALVQQEPDASSFPSGGLRETSQARGYTVWDPGSPVFIMDVKGRKTLCIPTVFISFTGEALGYKAPLIKSLEALNHAATTVAQYFDKNVKNVKATLGWEQEYFLIDKAMYYARPDLMASGRTLFGRPSPKGQQLDDHYFGSIPERVYAFMTDLEKEAHKLGIPVRTRHNEVAPAQFEFAPMFETVNIAVDHNQLLMNLLDRLSKRHDLVVLLHEKPFAGINGSGKHNNWSMATDTGVNLLSPGKTARRNLQFLTFTVNVVKAVYDHADLLRAAIAIEGNDYRLGANEAPPAIISIFLGASLSKALQAIENQDTGAYKHIDGEKPAIDFHSIIPDALLDNTDRNRTSPFAFTGNRFEFRAVGSSANCAEPMTVLNAIVANQLVNFKNDVDRLIAKGAKKDDAILKVLSDYVAKSKAILFEGDNYSKDWEKEAAKRGLSNIKTTPEALDAYLSTSSKSLYNRLRILTPEELEARHHVKLENYIMTVDIEAKTMEELVYNQIIPAAVRYQSGLIDDLSKAKQAGLSRKVVKTQEEIIEKLAKHISSAYALTGELTEASAKAEAIQSLRKQAIAYAKEVKPKFELIREHVDELELYVADDYWPLPKYREMLWMR